MANSGSRVYSYSPQPQPPPPPMQEPRRGLPLGMGCLGAILGLLLGVCALGGIALYSVKATPDNAIAQAAASDSDMTITVQEAYFNDLVTQSMPEGWSGDLQMDVQPGNKVAIGGKVKMTLFGQDVEGEVSGTVGINAQDGLIVLSLEDVQAFGFSLGSLGEAFTDTLWQDVSTLINQQVKDGLGENAQIVSITTSDTALTVQARLP